MDFHWAGYNRSWLWYQSQIKRKVLVEKKNQNNWQITITSLSRMNHKGAWRLWRWLNRVESRVETAQRLHGAQRDYLLPRSENLKKKKRELPSCLAGGISIGKKRIDFLPCRRTSGAETTAASRWSCTSPGTSSSTWPPSSSQVIQALAWKPLDRSQPLFYFVPHSQAGTTRNPLMISTKKENNMQLNKSFF